MQSIKNIVEEYLNAFPEEKTRLKQLLELIEHTKKEEDLYSRTNFVGHITASGFVISRKTKKVLRIYHKTWKMHLQPGGHFDEAVDSPVDVALREINREISIENLEYLPYHYNEHIPIDIDSHSIPENKKKNEPSHWHHDFRYLFMCDEYEEDEKEQTLKQDDVELILWTDITELQRLHTFDKLTEKIQNV